MSVPWLINEGLPQYLNFTVCGECQPMCRKSCISSHKTKINKPRHEHYRVLQPTSTSPWQRGKQSCNSSRQKLEAKLLKEDAESSVCTYDKAMRSLPLHTSTQRCDRCTCTHAHTHTTCTTIRSLLVHTPTQLHDCTLPSHVTPD